ncbi:MAG: zinc ribbon domain-containing protein [Verrucomicrobiota bacterium]|nr:zinc ribbon domain-containing protein [Verrucomicrobiota bacterium]
MPIYEFYCPDCRVIFNFLSKTINTEKRPDCPRCGKRTLEKQVSMFAAPGRKGGKGEGGEGDDMLGDLPMDEQKIERAIGALASEAEGMSEDDPRAAARLMRKFSNMTGVEYGQGMQEALTRMEAGEDMENVEKDMGDLLEGEKGPFLLPGQKGKGARREPRRRAPYRDPTLYEM